MTNKADIGWPPSEDAANVLAMTHKEGDAPEVSGDALHVDRRARRDMHQKKLEETA